MSISIKIKHMQYVTMLGKTMWWPCLNASMDLATQYPRQLVVRPPMQLPTSKASFFPSMCPSLRELQGNVRSSLEISHVFQNGPLCVVALCSKWPNPFSEPHLWKVALCFIPRNKLREWLSHLCFLEVKYKPLSMCVCGERRFYGFLSLDSHLLTYGCFHP